MQFEQEVVGALVRAAASLFRAGDGVEVERALPLAAHQHPQRVGGLARRAQREVGVGAELGRQALAQRLQRQRGRGGITRGAGDEEGGVGGPVERQRHHQHGAEQCREGEDRTEREADPAMDLEPETSQRGAHDQQRGGGPLDECCWLAPREGVGWKR